MSEAQLTAANHDNIVRASFRDIDSLPAAAMPYVAGLLSVQPNIPDNVRRGILNALSLRTDLHEVSPAVDAAMWIYQYGRLGVSGIGNPEFEKRVELLAALRQFSHLEQAASFMSSLAGLIDEELCLVEMSGLKN